MVETVPHKEGVTVSATEKKVLVVDDQYGIRVLLQEILLRDGIQIYQAANGNVALEIARTERPDLILLDMKMPGMDGLELLRHLKKEEMDAKVIMMTAYGELDMVEEATHLGALAHFTKPFDIMELRAEVLRQLSS
ncbi:MAG: response regulator [Firmicutes bacterium]|uniref:Two-component system, response regulator, stage 0 sporulation protein F n=1 Tax=Melghirimyces thermohalophilus TaxID=1236220 RepID=A0A1G6M961_9BACL|nr:response regulator [Melghirimyces thermohalophilus]MDA8352172.1 response regulator [Bacillota bacterium]SDC52132.1 two-component system, response regulator, stage 0 sporulation protein F [Melghirimyces thermohalophilus]